MTTVKDINTYAQELFGIDWSVSVEDLCTIWHDWQDKDITVKASRLAKAVYLKEVSSLIERFNGRKENSNTAYDFMAWLRLNFSEHFYSLIYDGDRGVRMFILVDSTLDFEKAYTEFDELLEVKKTRHVAKGNNFNFTT